MEHRQRVTHLLPIGAKDDEEVFFEEVGVGVLLRFAYAEGLHDGFGRFLICRVVVDDQCFPVVEVVGIAVFTL